MSRILLFFICIVVIISVSFAEERQESFHIIIDHGKLKVISPASVKKNVGVIIENKTMTAQHGKLRSKDHNLAFFAIDPSSSKSIEVSFEHEKKIIFTPLSPPFSEIELIPGREVYEIPPKK